MASSSSSSNKRPNDNLNMDSSMGSESAPSHGPSDNPNADQERWFAQIDTFVTGYSHHPGELVNGEDFLLRGKEVFNHKEEKCGWLAKEISPIFVEM